MRSVNTHRLFLLIMLSEDEGSHHKKHKSRRKYKDHCLMMFKQQRSSSFLPEGGVGHYQTVYTAPDTAVSLSYRSFHLLITSRVFSGARLTKI